MDYGQLLYEYENKYRKTNELLFKKFIEEFSKRSSFEVEKVISTSPFVFYYDKFWELHSYVLNKVPKDLCLFYSILEEMGANMKENLISYIRVISENVDEEMPDYVRDILLRVPIIDEITYLEGKVTVYSDKFGEYSFTPIREYFKNDWLVSAVLRHHTLAGECHNASWGLIKHLFNSSLVTMLLPAYFEGTYYHTAIKEGDNTIVDPANGSVFDIDTYNRLTEGTLISETKSEEMYVKLNETQDKNNVAPALVLALHDQQKSLK